MLPQASPLPALSHTCPVTFNPNSPVLAAGTLSFLPMETNRSLGNETQPMSWGAGRAHAPGSRDQGRDGLTRVLAPTAGQRRGTYLTHLLSTSHFPLRGNRPREIGAQPQAPPPRCPLPRLPISGIWTISGRRCFLRWVSPTLLPSRSTAMGCGAEPPTPASLLLSLGSHVGAPGKEGRSHPRV